MSKYSEILSQDKIEQIERGKRIKYIRENELKMPKTKLAKEIGVSGQFLGLVEDGKGNLVYKSIKKLRDLSGHSADYILYGLDDTVIDKTKTLLKQYDEDKILSGIELLRDLVSFIDDDKNPFKK